MRSRLQQRMSRRAIRYRSGWDVLRITLRREGPGGLYKGLLPNVLRVMPQVFPPLPFVLTWPGRAPPLSIRPALDNRLHPALPLTPAFTLPCP